MSFRRSHVFSALLATFACAVVAAIAPARAEDPAITRLLNKLPPPEKLVKPSVQKTLQQPDPVTKDPLVGTMVSALAHGNLAGGLAAARGLAAKHPKSAAAQELHALIAYYLRQFPEAAVALHRSVAIEPKRATAHLGLVIVELAQRHFSAALSHARTVTELEPGWADGWVMRSGCEEQAGNKEASASAAQHAVKLAPSMLAAWVQLARAENRLGHTQESLRALSKASEIAPDNAALQATVGFGYINNKHDADAVRPLARAAQLAPKDYLVQSQLGWALYSSGQTAAAIEHLRRGASLNPSYGPVWEHLGLVYQKAGRQREALEAFQRAARLMPSNRNARAHLLEAQSALGRGPHR
ncbi:MAG: tetratricopeptide repeat protein [Verrucomicrobiota bacterium]|nr:tetratricopeptide repeat protein [Verrucomicrobiota bacterium]